MVVVVPGLVEVEVVCDDEAVVVVVESVDEVRAVVIDVVVVVVVVDQVVVDVVDRAVVGVVVVVVMIRVVVVVPGAVERDVVSVAVVVGVVEVEEPLAVVTVTVTVVDCVGEEVVEELVVGCEATPELPVLEDEESEVWDDMPLSEVESWRLEPFCNGLATPAWRARRNDAPTTIATGTAPRATGRALSEILLALVLITVSCHHFSPSGDKGRLQTLS